MKRPTLPRSAHHYGLHPDTLVVHPDYAHLAPFLRSLPQRMARGEGEVIHRGRNELRIMHHDGLDLVVKAFHRPHVINRFVYGTLRASKAKRSYANACLLLDLGIGTPQPVGYYNVRSTLGLAFDKSYFVTLRSVCTHRYEEFFEHDMPEMPDVLRAIGHITARLHEAGLAHKDYGRANILFGYDKDGQLRIELVDLNRMAHGPLDIHAGCKNFERLPATPEMHRLMAETYAADRGFDADECFRLMQQYRSTQGGKVDGKY